MPNRLNTIKENNMETLQRVNGRLRILNKAYEKALVSPESYDITELSKYIRFNTNLKLALVKQALSTEIANLKQAAKTRVKRFKVLNPRVDLNGLYQESVEGRTPIDIYYFKKLVKVININGKATLVTRALEQPVTWRGTTGNNVTIMDRSKGKKVIYQAHRIVYAITTGIDPVESDIGYIDGNKDNYSFSNLIYKG